MRTDQSDLSYTRLTYAELFLSFIMFLVVIVTNYIFYNWYISFFEFLFSVILSSFKVSLVSANIIASLLSFFTIGIMVNLVCNIQTLATRNLVKKFIKSDNKYESNKERTLRLNRFFIGLCVPAILILIVSFPSVFDLLRKMSLWQNIYFGILVIYSAIIWFRGLKV